MKSKIILSLVAVFVATAGLIAMSAFEAHVINVTAHIENALTVDTTPIEFGTVFPQEYLTKQFDINLSSSFLSENRVDDISYVIKQKPMPRGDRNEILTFCDGETTKQYTRYQYCHYVSPNDPGYAVDGEICTQNALNYYDYCYLSLCPFLSKTDGDPSDNNDTSHLSYYADPTPTQPNDGDEYCLKPGADASGNLVKSEQDISDNWVVDLKVPPVKGYIGQEWPEGCPYVDEDSQNYGCELWIEVTGISESPAICEDKADLMLVLDRSGSISSPELLVLQNAAKGFATALAPSQDGIHMGQTSFSDNGSLDLHLTDNVANINSAIDGLIPAIYTNLYEGISLAKGELDNPGDGHDRADADSPDYMVIITDGDPNRPLPGDPEQLAIDAAGAAKSAGVKIFVVGVGTTETTADWLKNNIASGPEYYFDAADFAALGTILQNIATCQEQPSQQELSCIASGGTVQISQCCLAAGDFPDMCEIGTCGCAPEFSHEIKTCACPAEKCFDGNSCVVGIPS